MFTALRRNHEEFASWSLSDKDVFELGELDQIETLIVDGDELSWVHNQFENLPYHRTEEPMIWTGDYARFIAGCAGLKNREIISGLEASSTSLKRVLEWSENEKLKDTDLRIISETEYVRAAGRELVWIVSQYNHVPYCKAVSTHYWTGDLAKFVVAHLPAVDGQQ